MDGAVRINLRMKITSFVTGLVCSRKGWSPMPELEYVDVGDEWEDDDEWRRPSSPLSKRIMGAARRKQLYRRAERKKLDSIEKRVKFGDLPKEYIDGILKWAAAENGKQAFVKINLKTVMGMITPL